MEEMLALVSTREELISNIKRFNADLPNDDYLQSLLSLFRHWYYIEELDAFGPSKFIGYTAMTGERYSNKNGLGADGRETLHHLKSVLHAVPTDNAELREKLTAFLDTYNKQPNALAKVHTIPDVKITIMRNNRTTLRPKAK